MRCPCAGLPAGIAALGVILALCAGVAYAAADSKTF